MEEGLNKLLELLDKHDIKATFYATAITAEHFPKTIRKLREQGFEIGCHGYKHEFLGVPFISISTPKLSLYKLSLKDLTLLSIEEINSTIVKATQIVSNIAGVKIKSFKAPWMTLHPKAYKTLENLGYKVSTSIPVWKYGGPLHPYHPSTEKWLEEGDSAILELPISVDPLPMVYMDYRVLHSDFSSYTLRTMGLDFVLRALKRIIIAQKALGGPIILVFCTIISEYMSAPLNLKSNIWINIGNKLLNLMDKFLTEVKRKIKPEFLTAIELADLWEENYCNKHGKLHT